MSRAGAIDRREAVRQVDEHSVSAVHGQTHVGRKPYCSRGRGTYARGLEMSIAEMRDTPRALFEP
jgi:hypothetical protein